MPSVVAEVGSTANNYQVLAKLATGGMAEIFLARGASAGGVERYVVLKRILRERATDKNFVQMFLEEARLAAQLNHPNVAQVYDIGKLGDSYFFTMEYVHGETVRALLHRARSLRREIPLGNIFTVIANAAAGLHHAHERIGIDGRPLGIVHRDVSPSNLMISYEGSVKVVDFGVAKAENRASETRSGTVKGKISYLSPEQCRGTSVDRRSDLFSLGIVFWEMLTTERLYRRQSDFENMHAIVTEPPPPPSTRRPGLAPEVDALALRLLAKNVEDRFQTADEVVEALEAIAGRVSATISPGALSRFLRELFGQRPEPWVEMEQREAPEGVTVTSEPVPPELIAKLDPVDMSLARVRDLSALQMSTSQSQDSKSPLPPSVAPAPSQLLAAAMPASAIDNLPTLRQRPQTEAMDTLAPSPPAAPLPVPGQPLAPGQPLPSPPVPMAMAMPMPMHASGPMTSYPVAQQAWLAPPVDVQNQALAPRSNKTLFLVIAVAIALGVITSIIVSRRDDSGAEAPADAAIARAAVDAGTTGARTERDAAPVAVAADAAVVADAAVAIADPPVVADAAVVAVTIDAAPPPVAVDAAVAPVDARPRVTLAERIERAFDAGRWADTVSACTERVPSDHAAQCTQAACRVQEAGKARSWLAKVPSAKRKDVIAVCKQSGIDLAPPTSVVRPPRTDAGVVDCLKEPLACQH